MLTATQLQQEIAYELGGALPLGPPWDAESTQLVNALLLQLPMLWSMYNSYANIAFRQMLYTKRRAVEILIGQMRTKRDGQLGAALKVQGSILFKNLQQIRANVIEEIKEVEARARANQPPGVGRIWPAPPPIPVPFAPQPSETITFAVVNGTLVATTTVNPGPAGDPGSPAFTGGDPRVRPIPPQP